MGFPSGVLQDVSSAWSCLRRRADAVPERTLTVEAGARSMVLGMSLTASTHSVFFMVQPWFRVGEMEEDLMWR